MNTEHASITAPKIASTQNTTRQSATVAITPPASGATTGARDVMSASTEYSWAARWPWAMSETTARAITTPAAPARPCTNRRASTQWMSGATMIPTDASRKIRFPVTMSLCRPSTSESGPSRN